MKSHEKIVFGIIVAIFLVIIIALLLGRGKEESSSSTGVKSPEKTVVADGGSQGQSQGQESQEEELKVKVNQSPKLKETKKVDDLEIKNIQITTIGETTQLIADVVNPTSVTKGEFTVAMKMVDEDGNEITTAHGYIGKVEPLETIQLNASKTFDYSDAYDFEIVKE